ncbi:MAG: hypothetical protein ABSH11_11810 [Verrucomicrobiota bacterium]
MQRKIPIQRKADHIVLLPEVEKHLRAMGVEPPPELPALVFMGAIPEVLGQLEAWPVEARDFKKCLARDPLLVMEVFCFIHQRIMASWRKKMRPTRAQAVRDVLECSDLWALKHNKPIPFRELAKEDFESNEEVRKKYRHYYPKTTEKQISECVGDITGGPRRHIKLINIAQVQDKEIARYLSERGITVTPDFVRKVRRRWSKGEFQ